MGGAVSAGRNNNDLIDNLMESNLIRSNLVERVFRAVDRADYLLPESRGSAYKDLAWRCGVIHLSAPCIYSVVMEGLELREGLSFLNLGSGTGYLSTMVGLVLGCYGVNHGIEFHPSIITYANEHLSEFTQTCNALDEFEFCEPKFIAGNCLSLSPSSRQYDRVYCGAQCPRSYENYLKQLINVGGILVMPLHDNLYQIKRVSETEWVTHFLLAVSFASLIVPKQEESMHHVHLLDVSPPPLQELCRSKIRTHLRELVFEEASSLRSPPQRNIKKVRRPKTKIYNIPFSRDDDGDLNMFPELDPLSGAREMNALLSLVLGMGQNRAAGALRFDMNSNDEISTDEDDDSLISMVVDSNDQNDQSHSENDNKLNPQPVLAVNSDNQSEVPSCSHDISIIDSKSQINVAILDSNQTTKNDDSTLDSSMQIAEATSTQSATTQVADISNQPSASTLTALSSEDEIESKREKIDSGIGDEEETVHPKDNYSSFELSDDSDSNDFALSPLSMLGMTDSEDAAAASDDNAANGAENHRVFGLGKRQRATALFEDESDSKLSDRESSSQETRPKNHTSKMKKRSRSPPDPRDVRRNQISLKLQEKTSQLPLPQMLKVYVNMGRLL